MSREIKFRAWDREFNVMIPQVFVYDNENIVVLDVLMQELYEDKIASRLESVEDAGPEHYCITGGVELMQFTGLKDKNGTEIYEGDIVKVFFGQIYNVYEVVWDDHSAGFYFVDAKRNGDKYGLYTRNISLNEEKEVIGNRFQNPELL